MVVSGRSKSRAHRIAREEIRLIFTCGVSFWEFALYQVRYQQIVSFRAFKRWRMGFVGGFPETGGPATQPEVRPMRKWFVPLTVLGVGGIGAFLLTDKGRETMRRWRARLEEGPERWGEWNENAQLELERIQDALQRVAESLGPRSEMGR